MSSSFKYLYGNALSENGIGQGESQLREKTPGFILSKLYKSLGFSAILSVRNMFFRQYLPYLK